jgi:hypothetical protein
VSRPTPSTAVAVYIQLVRTHHSSSERFDPRQLRYKPLISIATVCTNSVLAAMAAICGTDSPAV